MIMSIVPVDCYDCPFSYVETYTHVGDTVYTEIYCNLLDGFLCADLGKEGCPLRNQKVLVKLGSEKSK